MTRFLARVLALAATSQAVVISWRTGMRTSEQSVTVASDEDVTFEWSGNHNVRLVTKEEFDRCDKTNAVAVGDRDESPYTMLAAAFAETFGFDTPAYFVCGISTHCEEGQKVAITMIDGSAIPEVDDGGLVPEVADGGLVPEVDDGGLLVPEVDGESDGAAALAGKSGIVAALATVTGLALA